MKLLNLPNELIHMISGYLPRKSLATLCLTNHHFYKLLLPTLYRHVELGNRTLIRQLEFGILTNPTLKHIIQHHTHTFTFNCRQGGKTHWSILSHFSHLPNVKRLYFQHFTALPITKVRQALTTFPQLQLLEFQYCELISDDDTNTPSLFLQEDNFIENKPTCINELNLIWTDFTTEAMQKLLCSTPNLNRVVLEANHNRKQLANNTALTQLMESCQDVKYLTISLQQVKEDSLCRTIQHYGSQLEQLSIRVEGVDTLKAVAKHAERLEKLVIRCSQYSGHYEHIMHVLQQCRRLTCLEMVNWPIQDMPSVVLDQIRDQKIDMTNTVSSIPMSSHSNSNHATSMSYIQGIKKTVALNRQDLQNIRKLCLY